MRRLRTLPFRFPAPEELRTLTSSHGFKMRHSARTSFSALREWLSTSEVAAQCLTEHYFYSYDEKRYKAVVHQCALERDFSLFDAGDMTEVGEKGELV